MRWFRCHRRTGSWLALLALATQLVLSFGHVHLGATDPAKVAAITTDAGVQTAPGGSDSGDKPDDYCAICAVLSLLSSAQVAVAPAVLLPMVWVVANFAFTLQAAGIGTLRTAFRSRAPPLS
jgi:Protein of unknown function (DUF2946)